MTCLAATRTPADRAPESVRRADETAVTHSPDSPVAAPVWPANPSWHPWDAVSFSDSAVATYCRHHVTGITTHGSRAHLPRGDQSCATTASMKLRRGRTFTRLGPIADGAALSVMASEFHRLSSDSVRRDKEAASPPKTERPQSGQIDGPLVLIVVIGPRKAMLSRDCDSSSTKHVSPWGRRGVWRG